MIVYNVGRGWFTEKSRAETARINQGLKPPATIKVEVLDRADLAALLNALTQPPPRGAKVPAPATEAMVEAACVAPHVPVSDVIPHFLLKEHNEREERMAKLRVNRGNR